MAELTEIAERLREVRAAHRKFIHLWALETIAKGVRPLDRVADDLERCSDDALLADPFHFDWSSLYRGSVLDD